MKKLMMGLWAVTVTALISACETRVEQPQYAELTYGHLGAVELNVAEVKILKAYQPSTDRPHVELEFPISPLETAARWAKDRLQSAGTSGTAVVTITDASVIETVLEKKGGLTGIFTKDQSERYDGTITMKIEATDPTGRMATTTATVKRSVTVAEDVSLNERSKIWYDFTEKIMLDLNRQMVESIRTHMKAFTF